MFLFMQIPLIGNSISEGDKVSCEVEEVKKGLKKKPSLSMIDQNF